MADIGIPAAAAARVPVRGRAARGGRRRAPSCRPATPEAHKGDAGRVLVVAGSPGKTGAAHLALTGALRGGAGLVTLAARPEVLPFALAGRPEAMSLALPGEGPLGPATSRRCSRPPAGVDALVIGPGIPRGPETGELLLELLSRAGRPAVLDADALNALADGPARLAGTGAPLLLTPHPGEMARLCGTDVDEVQADRLGVATRGADAWGATVLLKGARTVVATRGAPAAVIPTGNPGLATGGTGDVLAGLCGALLAGGLPPSDAGAGGGVGPRPRRRSRPRAGSASAGSWPATWARRSAPSGRGGRDDRRPARWTCLASPRAGPPARRRRRGRSARGSGGCSRRATWSRWRATSAPGRPSSCAAPAPAPGVPADEVSSPSFAIVATYRGRLPVHHADLYRIADEDELYATGFGDLVGGDGALLVEWADRVPGALPAERLTMRLAHHATAPDVRRLEVEGLGTRHAALARALVREARRTAGAGAEPPGRGGAPEAGQQAAAAPRGREQAAPAGAGPVSRRRCGRSGRAAWCSRPTRTRAPAPSPRARRPLRPGARQRGPDPRAARERDVALPGRARVVAAEAVELPARQARPALLRLGRLAERRARRPAADA